MQDNTEQDSAKQDSGLLHFFVKRFVYSEMKPETPTDIEAANIIVTEMQKQFMQDHNHD